MNIAALRELWERASNAPVRVVTRAEYDHHFEEISEYLDSRTDEEVYPQSDWGCNVPQDTRANAELHAAAHNEMGNLLDVVEAAKVRVERGHDDACSHCLNPIYACDCGHELLRAALAKLEG